MKGIDVLKYAVQVKGVGVGAHGIRSRKDYPDLHAYASSVQGADHSSVAPEKDAVFFDSAVICRFNEVDWDTMIALLNTVTRLNTTSKELLDKISTRVLTLQRILLLLGDRMYSGIQEYMMITHQDSTNHDQAVLQRKNSQQKRC